MRGQLPPPHEGGGDGSEEVGPRADALQVVKGKEKYDDDGDIVVDC